MNLSKSDKFIDVFLMVVIMAAFVLKITGILQISWLWLFAPIWLPLMASLILMFILVCGVMIRVLIDMIKEK